MHMKSLYSYNVLQIFTKVRFKTRIRNYTYQNSTTGFKIFQNKRVEFRYIYIYMYIDVKYCMPSFKKKRRIFF